MEELVRIMENKHYEQKYIDELHDVIKQVHEVDVAFQICLARLICGSIYSYQEVMEWRQP